MFVSFDACVMLVLLRVLFCVVVLFVTFVWDDLRGFGWFAVWVVYLIAVVRGSDLRVCCLISVFVTGDWLGVWVYWLLW